MSEWNQIYGAKHKSMIIDTRETAKYVYINNLKSGVNQRLETH